MFAQYPQKSHSDGDVNELIQIGCVFLHRDKCKKVFRPIKPPRHLRTAEIFEKINVKISPGDDYNNKLFYYRPGDKCPIPCCSEEDALRDILGMVFQCVKFKGLQALGITRLKILSVLRCRKNYYE